MKSISRLLGGSPAAPRSEEPAAQRSAASPSFLARAFAPLQPKSRNNASDAERPAGLDRARPRAKLTKLSPEAKAAEAGAKKRFKAALAEALQPPRVPGKLTKLSPEQKATKTAQVRARMADQPATRFADLPPAEQRARLREHRPTHLGERSASASLSDPQMSGALVYRATPGTPGASPFIQQAPPPSGQAPFRGAFRNKVKLQLPPSITPARGTPLDNQPARIETAEAVRMTRAAASILVQHDGRAPPAGPEPRTSHASEGSSTYATAVSRQSLEPGLPHDPVPPGK